MIICIKFIRITLLGRGIVFFIQFLLLMREAPLLLYSTQEAKPQVGFEHGFRFSCPSCLKSVLVGTVFFRVFKQAAIKASFEFYGAQNMLGNKRLFRGCRRCCIAMETAPTSQCCGVFFLNAFWQMKRLSSMLQTTIIQRQTSVSVCTVDSCFTTHLSEEQGRSRSRTGVPIS